MRFKLRKRLFVAAVVSAATSRPWFSTGEPGYSVNAVRPQDLTAKTGTTVNWSFTWPEPHMIVRIVARETPGSALRIRVATDG